MLASWYTVLQPVHQSFQAVSCCHWSSHFLPEGALYWVDREVGAAATWPSKEGLRWVHSRHSSHKKSILEHWKSYKSVLMFEPCFFLGDIEADQLAPWGRNPRSWEGLSWDRTGRAPTMSDEDSMNLEELIGIYLKIQKDRGIGCGWFTLFCLLIVLNFCSRLSFSQSVKNHAMLHLNFQGFAGFCWKTRGVGQTVGIQKLLGSTFLSIYAKTWLC